MSEIGSEPLHAMATAGLAVLGALADSLQEAGADLATATPARLDQHTARQRELCGRLRELAGGVRDGTQVRTSAGLANDLQEATRRLAELNRNYAALLRRRRRTVDIFGRVLASSGTTYPAPQPISQMGWEEARAKG